MPRRSACCRHAATISTSSELPCAKAVGRESGQGDAPHAVEDDGVALLHQNLNPLRRVDARPHFLRQHGPVMRPTQLLELGGALGALLRLLLAEVAAGVLDRPRLARLDMVDQRLLQPLLRTRVDLAVRATLRVAGEVEGRTSMSSQ